MQIHRFVNKPSRKELFRIWNVAKNIGEIPTSWSYVRHGWVEQTYWGWALMAA